MFEVGDAIILNNAKYPKLTGQIYSVTEDEHEGNLYQITWDKGQHYIAGTHTAKELWHFYEQLKIWDI